MNAPLIAGCFTSTLRLVEVDDALRVVFVFIGIYTGWRVQATALIGCLASHTVTVAEPGFEDDATRHETARNAASVGRFLQKDWSVVCLVTKEAKPVRAFGLQLLRIFGGQSDASEVVPDVAAITVDHFDRTDVGDLVACVLLLVSAHFLEHETLSTLSQGHENAVAVVDAFIRTFSVDRVASSSPKGEKCYIEHIPYQ